MTLTLRLYRYFQGFLLILTAIFLLQKIFSGNLDWYIHERFMPLTVLSVIGLLVIGLVIFHAAHHTLDEEHHGHGGHDHSHRVSIWGLIMVILPLVVGVLIPAQPLSSSAITGKGLSSAAPVAASGAAPVAFDQAPDERNILDWIRLFNSPENADRVLGQDASVIGFVYHDPRLKDGQFLVSRFGIICCAADAFAIGMVVNWPQSAALPADQWIKVKGPVQSTQLGAQKLPLIQATSVEAIQVPDQPYLFP